MKIQWEYDLVEKPFCEQVEAIGWEWLEGDTDVSELTERDHFREVLLKDRLAAALRKLNLRDGRPWLDDARIARAIRDLEQAAGHRLMEVNQSATELLFKGTVTDGMPGWEQGRPQLVRFIDFENPASNDFLVINQVKVELAALGPPQAERAGTPLFFRKPEQRPAVLRGAPALQSQQILVAGMLRPSYLLDRRAREVAVLRIAGSPICRARWTSACSGSKT